jgi:TRAP-type uncharacterized transport system fused permease subunit
MKTAFTSWKIAKGLYIIPIVMAYRPLLGNGPTGEVVLTVVLTAIGLIAFASALEGYLLRRLRPLEWALMYASALALFWPIYWLSLIGAAFFIVIWAIQWFEIRRLKTTGKPSGRTREALASDGKV